MIATSQVLHVDDLFHDKYSGILDFALPNPQVFPQGSLSFYE